LFVFLLLLVFIFFEVSLELRKSSNSLKCQLAIREHSSPCSLASGHWHNIKSFQTTRNTHLLRIALVFLIALTSLMITSPMLLHPAMLLTEAARAGQQRDAQPTAQSLPSLTPSSAQTSEITLLLAPCLGGHKQQRFTYATVVSGRYIYNKNLLFLYHTFCNAQGTAETRAEQKEEGKKKKERKKKKKRKKEATVLLGRVQSWFLYPFLEFFSCLVRSVAVLLIFLPFTLRKVT